jgi:hypothetical protein
MPRHQEDPRVTDLRRYRKARELQKRRAPPRPRPERLLGPRPRAGLILAMVILALAALSILPVLQRWI